MESPYLLRAEKDIKSVQNVKAGTKLIILVPIGKRKKGELKDEFLDLLRKGYTRAKVDGQIINLNDELVLDKNVVHDVDVVIDRLVVNEESHSRIAEGLTNALEVGQGICSIFDPDSKEEILYSMHAFSPASGLSYTL